MVFSRIRVQAFLLLLISLEDITFHNTYQYTVFFMSTCKLPLISVVFVTAHMSAGYL